MLVSIPSGDCILDEEIAGTIFTCLFLEDTMITFSFFMQVYMGGLSLGM